MPKTVIIPISLPQKMAKELDKVARTESMTRSEFVRDMLRRQMSFYRLKTFQKEAARRASEYGFVDMEDIVKAVSEIRSKKK